MFKIVLFTFFPVTIASFFVFDGLVRREYFHHRRDWEADGKPHGVFWVPRELIFAGGLLVWFASSIAKDRRWFAWLFSTPEWMKRDRKAHRLVLCLRTLVLGWYLALIALLLLNIFT
jgi:hypothetical protein